MEQDDQNEEVHESEEGPDQAKDMKIQKNREKKEYQIIQ